MRGQVEDATSVPACPRDGAFRRQSKEAIDKMEKYAELFINGDFLLWYYVAAMAARLVPIGKKARTLQEATAAVPPMCPVTCGDHDLAVIMGKMVDNLRPAFTSYSVPQQLCVRVKGAEEIIVYGLRTTVEHTPNKVVLVLDIKKAYPSVERATIAQRLLKVPDINNYLRLFDALNKSGRVLSTDRAGTRLFEEETTESRLADADEGFLPGLDHVHDQLLRQRARRGQAV